MIVYIPTPITSVEQAESLPERTVAIQSWGHGTTARTLTNGRWITPSGAALPNAEAIGFTALVPVEAKEETITVQTRGQAHPDWRTRLTTPWKWIDGPSPDRRGDCA
ncbi:hypothetical protein M3G50_07420 [Brachybacterium muris]|uniref:hypothetical protein n=1 Tax=Brachybacterium muris TaxID=219301 RepID=UPI0021A9081E|nr:hypothetical protein [Brachybacterium muris]MCT1430582.1 hypothetical protein [Brachybacterium muris]